jgi:hypothetical protein
MIMVLPSRPGILAFLGTFLTVIAVAAYVLGRLSGLVSLAAIERGGQTQWGFFGESTRLKLKTPVWLNRGEALGVDYDVDARHGSLLLEANHTSWTPGLARQHMAYAQIEGRRTGQVLFVAQTSGLYAYGSEPTSLGGPRCPEKRELGEVMLGSAKCPTFAVTYSLQWRVVARPAASAADVGTRRITVPRHDQPTVWEHVR